MMNFLADEGYQGGSVGTLPPWSQPAQNLFEQGGIKEYA